MQDQSEWQLQSRYAMKVCHEGQWPTLPNAKAVTQAVAVPAVGVEMWGSISLGVTVIPGGGILELTFYFSMEGQDFRNLKLPRIMYKCQTEWFPMA